MFHKVTHKKLASKFTEFFLKKSAYLGKYEVNNLDLKAKYAVQIEKIKNDSQELNLVEKNSQTIGFSAF